METEASLSMESNCPHSIKVTSLDGLESREYQARLRSILDDQYLHLFDGELKREIKDALCIESNISSSPTDAIDKHLCAYIKVLELATSDARVVTSDVDDVTTSDDVYHWERLIMSLNFLSPHEFFKGLKASDPAVDWLFKHRVMKFLRYSINFLCKFTVWDLKDEWPIFWNRLGLIADERIHIDLEDCRSIMTEVIYPQLSFYPDLEIGYDGKSGWYSYDSGYCLEPGWCEFCELCDMDNCEVNDTIRALCKRHKSLLKWSVDFSMQRLHEGKQSNRLNQAMHLLGFLLRAARDIGEWQLVRESMDHLFNSEREELRARFNWLYGLLVEKNADNLEELSSHLPLSSMVGMFNDPSDEIRTQNRRAWLSIGYIHVIGPKGYEALREVADLWLLDLDKTLESCEKVIWPPYEYPHEATELTCVLWMMMPRPTLDQSNPSYRNQLLVEDLGRLLQREKIIGSLGHCFGKIMDRYVWTSRELKAEFNLIRDRTCWFLIKRLCELLAPDDLKFYFVLACDKDFNPSSNNSDCELYYGLLKDVHDHICQQVELAEIELRFPLYFQFIMSIDSWRHNEEKMKVAECLIARSNVDISIPDRKYGETLLENARGQETTQLDTGQMLRLLYFVKSKTETEKVLAEFGLDLLWQYDFQQLAGIQSRRLVLMSLCKLLIINAEHFLRMLPAMIDLFVKLQLAYELRDKQEYSNDETLAPTCVELAFPSPFDDPESPIYVCEFAYFRDVLDYLDRNWSRQLEDVRSSLDEEKRQRLNYYQNEYDGFDICCRAVRIDASRVNFRCIEHRWPRSGSDQMRCPLLGRIVSGLR